MSVTHELNSSLETTYLWQRIHDSGLYLDGDATPALMADFPLARNQARQMKWRRGQPVCLRCQKYPFPAQVEGRGLSAKTCLGTRELESPHWFVISDISMFAPNNHFERRRYSQDTRFLLPTVATFFAPFIQLLGRHTTT